MTIHPISRLGFQMIFESVTLHNFLSYKHHTFQFKEGLFLIRGHNGAGKSAVLSAIEWVLFGKVTRDQKSKELIRDGADSALVDIEIKIAGQRLIVTRTVSKSKSGLQVSIDGKDLTKSTLRDTQATLEGLLGFDHKAFCAVALYAQGAASMAALGDAEKKAILERVLGFERFRKGRTDAQEKLKELKAKTVGMILQRDHIKTLRASEIRHKEQLEAHKTAVLENLEISIRRINNSIDILPKPVDPDLEDEQKKLAAQICQNSGISSLHFQTMQDRSDYEDDLRLIDLDSRIAAQTLSNLMESDIPAFSQETQRCPTCEQVVNDAGKWMELKSEQEQSERDRSVQIENLEAKRANYTSDMTRIEADIAKCDVQLKDLEQDIKEHDQVAEFLAVVSTKIARYYAALESYNNTLALLTGELEEAKKVNTDHLDDDIAELQARIRQMDKDVSLLDYAAKESKEKIPYYEFWVKAFGRGIQTLVIDTALPYLNKRANLYLSALTDGEAVVEVRAQSETQSGEKRDKISIEASYAHGPNTYGGKSGGEKRRVDLAIQLALGDLVAARHPEPIMWRALDEITENLDADGCERVVDVLQKHVAPAVGTVLVISHNEEMQDKFENIISVVKENGVSHVR